MTTVINTDLRTVMRSAQVWLASALDWPIERVAVNDPDVMPLNFQADQYVVIWFASSDLSIKGGGRCNTQEDIRLTFTLRTRLALDDATSGLIWLTDAADGHATIRHQILDCLLDHVLKDVDPDGNWLIVRGLKPAPCPKIRRNKKPDTSWGECTLTFSALYQLNLTTPFVPW